MKKQYKIATWILLSIGFLVLWGFSSAELNNKTCRTLNINIQIREKNTFISKQEVEVELSRANLHPVGKRLSEIDLMQLENVLDNIPEVKKSAVSKNLNGNVSINVIQRTPIVRIINANGNQFYLDEDGFQMPLSDNYSARVPVATGYINDPVSRKSVVEIVKNEVLAKTIKSDEVFKLVSFINSSKFWKAQIQQINFNAHNDIELIPTVGNHLIIMGNLENMEGKLNKLKLFYNEGLNHLDWNLYDTINIKYKNQIICTKK